MTLSCLAGSKSNDIGVISMVDGKNVLNSDAMIQAFDFYSGLVQDGSSIRIPQTWQRRKQEHCSHRIRQHF